MDNILTKIPEQKEKIGKRKGTLMRILTSQD
jgi:hypothetical protein